MKIKEIKAEDLNVEKFITEKVEEISSIVGDGTAISALSGGVDSSTVTMIGHRALGDGLETYFVDNGLMREDEPRMIVSLFARLDVPVTLVNASDKFFKALKGKTDPEDIREAITQTFYKDVFARLVKESKAKYLLQGTNYTDIEETVAGIKRQHNILEQLGIDTKKQYGYTVIEPLRQLRKDGIRRVAEALRLPKAICNRIPFPGPGLATRVKGEITPERIKIVREATAITEAVLAHTDAFQYMAILHQDRFTGVRNGKRNLGLQIEVRCWDSIDATAAKPTKLSNEVLDRLANRITTQIPEVVSVTYNITPKPPSTMEAI